MLNIERLLQWNIALVVVLGALLLGLGNQDHFLPGLAIGAAGFSLLFVDKLQWFSLNRFAANLVALLVSVLPLLDFFSESNQDQLLSIARLLIHLQVVLLLEKKSPRIYWQLFVLSLLQVVVAAALRLDLEGGLLFAIYILFDFSAMILMLLHRDVDRIAAANKSSRNRKQNTLALLNGNHPAQILRAPMLLTFEQKIPSTNLVRRLLLRALGLTLMAIFFSGFLFYSIPRTGQPWFGASSNGGSIVGFVDSIRFNESSLLTQSSERVMRVALTNPLTGRQIELDDGLYLRGTVLEQYGREAGETTWQPMLPVDDPVTPLPQVTPGEPYIIQQLRLEPTNEPYLFSLCPARKLPDQDHKNLLLNAGSNSIRMNDEIEDRGDLNYQLAVLGIRRRTQSRLHPYRDPNTLAANRPMSIIEGSRLLFSPNLTGKRDLSYIQQLANQWAEEMQVGDNDFETAIRFEQRLKITEDFQYTLDFRNVPRDKRIDPIVDFLKNHRTGHCEYFASALALMLRSQGIPARLVVGYHSQLYNDVGGFYDVQQKHSHVWVEAYIGPQHVSQDMIARGDASRGGAWLRLDPTPGNPNAEDEEELLAKADNAFGYAQMLWDDFVVGLDPEKQEKAMIGNSWGDILESAQWQAALTEMDKQVQNLKRNPVQAAAVAGLILLAIIALNMGKRRKSKTSTDQQQKPSQNWLARLSPGLARILGQSPSNTYQKHIEFYQRLEKTLEKAGLVRNSSQTVHEFTAHACRELSQHTQRDSLQPAITLLAQAFDRVRYANQPLNDQTTTAIEHALLDIEVALEQTA